MCDNCVIASSEATFHLTNRDGVPVVEVVGEIDLATGGPMLATLTAQLDHSPPALVVDLTRITFFSSAGIRALLDAVIRARDLGVAMVVAADQPVVLRPLEITAVTAVLNIQPTVDRALAALPTTSPRAAGSPHQTSRTVSPYLPFHPLHSGGTSAAR